MAGRGLTVVFDDERPKRDHATITLEIPGLKTKGTFTKEIKNGAIKHDTITAEKVHFELEVTSPGEEAKNYVYEKSLPENIVPEKSKSKVKDGFLILELRKAESGSVLKSVLTCCSNAYRI